jgi:diadenosine tetraphosphate (Ap4A) HIT family hydrolase
MLSWRLAVTATDCPFCHPDPARIAWPDSPLVLALWDGFPVSPGHALIVPRRHAAGWEDLTAAEQQALLAAIDPVRTLISARHASDGFNVGFNDGTAAGQTVMHFHLHVIPRYAGDTFDPRGGVRWVLPEKAAYWRGGGP